MRKLFFMDVDGTLLDCKRNVTAISKNTEYAIKQLIKDQHYVVIATGRSKPILNEDLKACNPSGLILVNGGYVEFNNKQIEKILFSTSSITLIENIIKLCGGVCMYESDDEMVVKKGELVLITEFIKQWNMPSLKIIEKEPDIENTYKITAVFDEEDKCRKFESMMKGISDCRKQENINAYDVVPKGINKGKAAEKIIEYLSFSKEDTYAFGDGINDIDMLKSVGRGIAVKNGNTALKEIADEICDDAINDGVYKWLVDNHLILPNKL
ncbi:MAG: Cof-type HAD-IIB family hydrolase [Erysipelotrichaceae bacterium]